MRLKEENPQLRGLVNVYSLEGFSFREYLNYTSGNNFPSVSLDDIIFNHEDISREIAQKLSHWLILVIIFVMAFTLIFWGRRMSMLTLSRL